MVAPAAPDWDDGEDLRLAELLDAQHGGEGLEAYIRRVSPRLPPPRHIRPLIDLWERTRHERVLCVVEMPPRHVKTTTGMHALAWRMLRDPTLMNGFATFGDKFAASRSRIVRSYAKGGGVVVPRDNSNAHEWGTGYLGGGLLAHGYRGEWTGRGITGVALLDDLYKDRADAESEVVRQHVWEWFTDVLWTRLEPGSSVIIQFTRWHHDDLIGRILQGKFAGYRFERLCLPAVCEDENDGSDRKLGEALWPEQYPIEELRRREVSMGDYSWSAMYQQRPRPKGAEVFLEPGRFSLREWVPDGHRLLICADPAASEDTRADYSALFVLAKKGEGSDMIVWVLYGWRGQVTIPAFARKLHAVSVLFGKWGRVPVVVESVAGFKAVPQTLKEIEPRLLVRPARMGMPIGAEDAAHKISNTPVNKFLRSQPCAAAWNAGRVRVPLDAELEWNPITCRFEDARPVPGGVLLMPRQLRAGVAPGVTWADELIQEASMFTGVNDAEDDQVDALAHGFNDLIGARRAPRGAVRNRNPYG
ncbi:MAG TPA: hypothetical protein VLN57_21070 [Xanthobacteraceae bacterium]|nr:hypothetical protein [Xanthobacteraceae bacterium]